MYLVADGQGAKAARRWMLLYTSPTHRRRRETGLGSYPDVSLEAARRQRDAWREKTAAGIDPLDEREVLAKARAEQAAEAARLDRRQAATLRRMQATAEDRTHVNRDDRRVCGECAHPRSNGQCVNWRQAGNVRPVLVPSIAPLWRCNGLLIRATQ